MFSTTSVVFGLLAGDRLSGSLRKVWWLKDAREWESSAVVAVRSSVLTVVVAGGGRQHRKKSPLCPAPRIEAQQYS